MLGSYLKIIFPTATHNPTMADWSPFPRLTGNEKKIVLAGDSVLDNFIWLKDPSVNLRVVMERMLQREASDTICLNFAVDQTMTFDFIRRTRKSNSWMGYQHERERMCKALHNDSLDRDGYKHLCSADGSIKSVDNIARLKNVKHIFLSVGGNDVYLRADVQKKLASSLMGCNGRHEVGKEFKERLNTIVVELKKVISSDTLITPVIVYHPHYDQSLSGLSPNTCLGSVSISIQKMFLSWLVTPMVRSVLEVCSQHSLSAIDLSQTFDPTNIRHYGNMKHPEAPWNWSGAEPSDVSQIFIAKLMMHVVNHPPTAPTIFHGKTKGDDFVSVVPTLITESVLKNYKFRTGV